MAAVSGPHAPADSLSLLHLHELEPVDGWDETGLCPVTALRALAITAAGAALHLADASRPRPTGAELTAVTRALEEQHSKILEALEWLTEGTPCTPSGWRLLQSPEGTQWRPSWQEDDAEQAESVGVQTREPARAHSDVCSQDASPASVGEAPGDLSACESARLLARIPDSLLDPLALRLRDPLLDSVDEDLVDKLASRLMPTLVDRLSLALVHPVMTSLGPQVLEKVLIPQKIVPALEKTLLPRLVDSVYQPVVDAINAKYSWSTDRMELAPTELPGSDLEIARKRRLPASAFLHKGGETTRGFGQRGGMVSGTSGAKRRQVTM